MAAKDPGICVKTVTLCKKKQPHFDMHLQKLSNFWRCISFTALLYLFHIIYCKLLCFIVKSSWRKSS